MPMKPHSNSLTRLVLFTLLWLAGGTAAAQDYQPNWESLDSRSTPQWWTDARFGIFIHWGVYAVPSFSKVGEYSEWYERYIVDGREPYREYHDKRFGTDFAYADFVPMFKADLFEPDPLVDAQPDHDRAIGTGIFVAGIGDAASQPFADGRRNFVGPAFHLRGPRQHGRCTCMLRPLQMGEAERQRIHRQPAGQLVHHGLRGEDVRMRTQRPQRRHPHGHRQDSMVAHGERGHRGARGHWRPHGSLVGSAGASEL